MEKYVKHRDTLCRLKKKQQQFITIYKYINYKLLSHLFFCFVSSKILIGVNSNK